MMFNPICPDATAAPTSCLEENAEMMITPSNIGLHYFISWECCFKFIQRWFGWNPFLHQWNFLCLFGHRVVTRWATWFFSVTSSLIYAIFNCIRIAPGLLVLSFFAVKKIGFLKVSLETPFPLTFLLFTFPPRSCFVRNSFDYTFSKWLGTF